MELNRSKQFGRRELLCEVLKEKKIGVALLPASRSYQLGETSKQTSFFGQDRDSGAVEKTGDSILLFGSFSVLFRISSFDI